MEQEEIESIARELRGWLENAVSDCSFEATEDDIVFSYGKKYREKIRRARRAGVVDLVGWLAEELYNDPDVVSDMVRDRLYDSAKTDEDRCAIAKELGERAHPALAKACTKFIKRRSN